MTAIDAEGVDLWSGARSVRDMKMCGEAVIDGRKSRKTYGKTKESCLTPFRIAAHF
jgi:hypothetical protein